MVKEGEGKKEGAIQRSRYGSAAEQEKLRRTRKPYFLLNPEFVTNLSSKDLKVNQCYAGTTSFPVLKWFVVRESVRSNENILETDAP